jgi:hypothetical protein
MIEPVLYSVVSSLQSTGHTHGVHPSYSWHKLFKLVASSMTDLTCRGREKAFYGIGTGKGSSKLLRARCMPPE